jgi:uncharacterized protein
MNRSSCLLVSILFFIKPDITLAQSNNVTSENVTFKSEGVTLAGTILKPKNPYAAVVIIDGSGQTKRKVDFAAKLANEGIAVLTYDKRGVGESGGEYAGPEVGTNNIDALNLTLLSLDVREATTTLKTNLNTKNIPIGLLGFSQAGWIIPLAAAGNQNVNFMVIFSGPVITAKEQLRFQFFTKGNVNFWDTHTEAEAREHILKDPDMYEFIDTDPRVALAKVTIPGLWIYGGKDIQVPAKLSIENLSVLKSTGKLYEHNLFPSLGHNTAFSNDPKPFETTIQWIKLLSRNK